MFESLASFLLELLHIVKCGGQSGLVRLQRRLKRRKRSNRRKTTAVVCALTAAATESQLRSLDWWDKILMVTFLEQTIAR